MAQASATTHHAPPQPWQGGASYASASELQLDLLDLQQATPQHRQHRVCIPLRYRYHVAGVANLRETFVPSLLLRALPPEIHQALKRRASLNGRSLQREVHSILRDAVGDASDARMDAPALHVSNAPMVGKIGRDEIYRDGR